MDGCRRVFVSPGPDLIPSIAIVVRVSASIRLFAPAERLERRAMNWHGAA
jgi:hypothetical protein